MTWGGHVVETMRVRAYTEACLRMVGLSWGNTLTRERYAEVLAPFDRKDNALSMASEQSSCALVCCAALLDAGIDGLVARWRNRPQCDPLREPRVGHYDALMFLETLAYQRSVRRKVGTERPEILAGSWVLIGGGSGDGGGAHIVCVVDVEHDGTLVTVEGGKSDPGNPKPGAKNCTRVAADRRELYPWPGGGWGMRDAHTTRAGRRAVYWCWVGDLPALPEGA